MKIFKFFSRILLLLIFAVSILLIFFKPDELIEFQEVFQAEMSSRKAEAEAKAEDEALAETKKVPIPKGVNQDLEKTVMTTVNMVLIFLISIKRTFFVKFINLHRKIIDLSPPEKRKFYIYLFLAPIVGSLIYSLINLIIHWPDLFTYAEWVEGFSRRRYRSIHMNMWSTGWVYLLCEFSKVCSHYLFLRLIYEVDKENEELERRKIVESRTT
jgi:hypothetical protein